MQDLEAVITANQNGVVTTTSRDVAEKFGKRHGDVIRAVEALDCSAEFRERNFAFSSYRAGTRTYPYTHLTRDGFCFLVMGFTGQRAAEWKEKYITAFNQMETELRQRAQAAVEYRVEKATNALAVLEDLHKEPPAPGGYITAAGAADLYPLFKGLKSSSVGERLSRYCKAKGFPRILLPRWGYSCYAYPENAVRLFVEAESETEPWKALL